MLTKVYWIHKFDNTTRLGIMARPRGEDWLYDEIVNLKKQNVGLLVCKHPICFSHRISASTNSVKGLFILKK